MKSTTSTCPKCGRPVSFTEDGAYPDRLVALCPCTPQGPVIETSASPADATGAAAPSEGARPTAAESARELQAVPGIGPELAQALRERNIWTLEDLAKTSDAELLSLPHVGAWTLASIRAHLETHVVQPGDGQPGGSQGEG